jgi:hypothetical protein
MGRLLGQGRSERPLPKFQTSAIAPILLSATGTFKAIDHLSEIGPKADMAGWKQTYASLVPVSGSA